MSDTDDIAQMSFEQAMSALEDVVARLESGDVALEDSIALYERGAALRKLCAEKLAQAEAKIAKISLDGDGSPTGTQPLDGA